MLPPTSHASISNLLLLADGQSLTDRALAITLAVGFILLFVTLVVLVWTRWGQVRPIAKCVLLSLAAHVLLLIYAYSTRVLFDQPGSWLGQTTKVHLVDADDYEEAAPLPEEDEPTPWEQAGLDSAELAVNSTADGNAESATPDNTSVTAAADAATPQPDEPASEPAPQPAPTETGSDTSTDAPPEQPQPAETTSQPPEAGLPEDLTELIPEVSEESQPNPALATDVADAETPPPAETLSPPPTTDPANTAAVDSASMASAPPSAPPASETTFAAAPAQIPRRLGDGQELAEPLRARVAADRLKVAQQFGATPQSEAAVAAALEWLAANQSADGRWDADLHGSGRETRTLGHDRQGAGAQADTGVTGLALLAFLGNGQSHLDGTHRENVQHGLEFLLASQAQDGNLAGNAELFAAMYCHGIATLALSEAYALTGDERLLPGLQRALHYTITVQHTGGGWRYQPYDAGDISQFGWQLMALKSAELAGIPIPAETRAQMQRFLRSASSGRARGLASYRPGDRVSRTMTAEALVCRYFLAAENSPAALAEGAAYVSEEKPGDGQTNLYYWYYGTLAMFQRQGPEWEAWNAGLQRQLLHSQRFDGERRGSWDPDPLWGGYGGRVYSTATAALCLEVYYRYLPLYGEGRTPAERLTDRIEHSPYSR
jgi:hypothetical protein